VVITVLDAHGARAAHLAGAPTGGAVAQWPVLRHTAG
jgi:hypothetical protein